jgi:3-oxoacyl-[acyl-carrier protein] reductase
MDLGIAGRKALVCASSKGLGRACAEKLAEAGCEVVVNGRSRDTAEATAADIRKTTGAKVTAVAADVASPEGQAALFAACAARHSGHQQLGLMAKSIASRCLRA